MFWLIKWVAILSFVAFIWIGYLFWNSLAIEEKADLKRSIAGVIDSGGVERLRNTLSNQVGLHLGRVVASVLSGSN